ncbi:hypothetical protein ABFS82_09G133600 [Erythranthe guttata]|uniref:B-box zinc finger protein 32 n=1 Tax=Erythranthe guttata TaxID=4155 RepID=UPI00064DCA86|nr:PREDICTED: B-box zinc finger protein 32 [Erythranthe guttata]|eukprot:XP_012856232.1 PREDICTED: B-box zinc finger protein 32 [Erythranthe guttata]
MIMRRHCELCSGEAAVFCSADNAHLCWSCDARVHSANFLVARHVRQFLCSACNNLTGHSISGVGSDLVPATCSSCPTADDVSSLSSDNSSVCISSTTSPAKKLYCGGGGQSVDSSSSSVTSERERKSRVDIFEAEGVFVNWYGKLGVGDDVAVRMASRAMRVFLGRLTVLPFRICLAASVWHGLRFGSVQTWQVLKRLEEISGAPAKIILAAASKLERAVKVQRRRRLELEEGWAEC